MAHGIRRENGRATNYWERTKFFDPSKPFGVVQVYEAGGRNRLKMLEARPFNPDQDQWGFFPLVRDRLVAAVGEWVEKGWVTREQILAVLPAVAPPAPPRPVVIAPPPPIVVPAYELPQRPGRQAAQRLMVHLRRLDELGVDTPEVDQEMERLEGDLQGWLDQVEEAFSREEEKEAPNEERLARLQEQRDALQEAVTALADRDIGQAIEALDRAFPARAPRAVPTPRRTVAERLEEEGRAFRARIEDLRQRPDLAELARLEEEMLNYFDRVLEAREPSKGVERQRLDALAERLERAAAGFEQAREALARRQRKKYLEALDLLAECCPV